MMLRDCLVAIATILFIGLKCTDAHLAVMSVDLGSEYMKIALVKPGVPMEIITNEDSARKTAAIVCLRNGERLFGNPAEHCATKYPSNAFWYLTQIVGKKFDDPAVAQYQKRFPYYKLVKDENRGTVIFEIDETQYTPEELLAMILEKAKQYAETFADQTISDVVITVPSFFNQAERRAVRMAAELSGLNILQLIGDNAAVALNYGVFRRKQFNNSMTYIMFYDMGATSTTATIVGYQVVKMKEGTRMVENPQLVIKGVGFDKELGGLEISIRLRDHLAKYFSEHKKTKTDLYTNYRAMAKLLKEAKRVKKVLSANMEHMAQVEGLLDDEDFKMKVSRDDLEKMCADMFERVTTPIQDALKASEITMGEISDVILMGGGTRIPAVQARLLDFLGGIELGKSLNTDEAAAMGAVYQAAYLGKGFKVLTFGVKEANIYPIVVEFEKHRNEESTDPPKIIKRTLFSRMNAYPLKKVMTFNKHFKDFNFNVTYGELDFLPEEEAKIFRALQGQISEIGLRGLEEVYTKHADAKEAKGIKAHFKMDESGILTLDLVESIFEKEDKVVEEESTWSKLGDTLTGLFGNKDDKGAENAELPTEGGDKAESETGEETQKEEEPKTGDETVPEEKSDQPEQAKPDPDDKKEEEEEVPADGDKQNTDEGTKEEKKEETEGEKKTEDGEKKEDKTDGKKEDKKEEGEKKPKIIIVKENITVETSITDTKPPSNDSIKASKKKLADLTAKDKEKKLLEKSKNELESFVYETMDKLSHDEYIKCSTEEEREKYSTLLSEASDWLYEQEEDTPKETYVDKLKSLKKETKQMMKRVKEFKERPEAIATLDSMLNQSSFFLDSIKNITNIEAEDKVFTNVEIETLEKLINETEAWKETKIKEQSETPDYEKPKLLVEDIAFKMQALDREVKYLIHKAKTFRPKPKAKPAKNKTETNNTKTDTSDKKDDSDSAKEDVKIDIDNESTSLETEIPAPPTGDDTEQTAEQEGEAAEETTQKPTEEPKERNTHNPEDL